MRVKFLILITIVTLCGCSKSSTNNPSRPATNPFNVTGTFTVTIKGVQYPLTILSYYLLPDGHSITFEGGGNSGSTSSSQYVVNLVIYMPTKNEVTLGQYSTTNNQNSLQYETGGTSNYKEWDASTTSVVVFNVVSYDASNHYEIQITFSGTITDSFGNSISVTNGNINAQLW